MARKQQVYLAADLGAESGRVIAGLFDGRKLVLKEMHRFPNVTCALPDGLHWDSPRLFHEIKTGIRAAVAEYGRAVASVGVDTWGVDFGLMDGAGAPTGLPSCYRDERTAGMMKQAFRKVPREKIYAQTGIQFMELNTLYQLLAMVRKRAPALTSADRLLFTPDLMNYWLTGVMAHERTIASTSQCYNPKTGRWAKSLLRALDIPERLFGEILNPGTPLGPLRKVVADEVGHSGLLAIAVGGHDTASAVAAVPAAQGSFAYLSSGTWSLIGVERSSPIINAAALNANLTNECGVEGTIRLLKNIMGLWLIQQCRATWRAKGGEWSYEELARLAGKAKPFTAVVDPMDPSFFPPGDMPARIRAYCARTGQRAPADRGTILRVARESLALAYRKALEQISAVTGERPSVLHIVGGGIQTSLQNQMAADATGLPVVAGPVEATAAGNILVQMMARGDLRSLREGRELVRRSFGVETYEPRRQTAWDEAYARFRGLTGD